MTADILGAATNVLLQNDDDYDDDSEEKDQRSWMKAEDRNGDAERQAEDEGSCLWRIVKIPA